MAAHDGIFKITIVVAVFKWQTWDRKPLLANICMSCEGAFAHVIWYIKLFVIMINESHSWKSNSDERT